MKTFILQLYKDSGKWYADNTIIVEDGYTDARRLVIENWKNKWNGYITVHELQEDGHLQPIRLITKEELSSFYDWVLEDKITSTHEYKKGRGWSSSI